MFFLPVPIYGREVCIVVGMTHQEAVVAAKKQKCSKDFIAALNLEETKDNCDNVAFESNVQGTAVKVNNTSYFMFLKPYSNQWDYLDILNHECFHISQFIGHTLNMWDNVEPPAYLHTWLFKTLRRMLSGLDKI